MVCQQRSIAREETETPVSVRFLNVYRTSDNRPLRMTDLFVKSTVKDQLADNNVASDFYAALDEEVAELLEGAARRTEVNDRRAVQPRDL